MNATRNPAHRQLDGGDQPPVAIAIARRKWEKATVLLWTAVLLSPVRADAVLDTLTDDTGVDS